MMRRLLLGAIIPAAFLIVWEGFKPDRAADAGIALATFGYRCWPDTLRCATARCCLRRCKPAKRRCSGCDRRCYRDLQSVPSSASVPTAERVAGPTIEALRPIPAIAFMPLALMMFGFGVGLEASIVAYACVWPILIVTIAAVRAVEGRLLEVAAVLNCRSGSR